MNLIRKNLVLVIVTSLFIGLNACCNKKDCAGFDELNEIQMLNFAAADVDSISFEIFEAGSNFSSRLDSSFSNAHDRTGGSTELILFVPEYLQTTHAYRVTLHSTGQVYQLTDFTVKKEECNCPSDKYHALESYVLNGTVHRSATVAISN